MKISTAVLCSFSAMLMLMVGVAGVSTSKTDAIGQVANDLANRIVVKTQIAAAIVGFEEQIRFFDPFLFQAADADQDAQVRALISIRTAMLVKKIDMYKLYAGSELERRLLDNLERSRIAYMATQARLMALQPDGRRADPALKAELAQADEALGRQAKGLAHLAETEVRQARQQATSLSADGRNTVLGASALAFAVGVLILLLLRRAVFRPLAHITRNLLGLADGRLDVPVFQSGRGDEIESLSQALEVFRRNAVALLKAHEDTKSAHRRADLLARHDALTGLPNRRVLKAVIDRRLVRTEGEGEGCAVLVLDLDRFKPINDVMGHAAGDKVLCEVAERLRDAAGAGETVARLGGDEFAVVMTCGTDGEAPARLAQRLLRVIASPMTIDGRTVSVGTSIGIALAPGDGREGEQLLHAADLAMLKSKREGKNRFGFFEPQMDIQLRARAECEAHLRLAIDHDAVRPFFQPLLALRDGTIKGFEILARWHDGERDVPPCEFIPAAEEAGLIPALTASILRQACREARDWPGVPTLALNVTPAQIADPRLPEVLLGILAQEGFPAARLELEVTEDALIGDITAAHQVITTFQAHGVRVSLDDFGTGYSSLHHLRDLRFDTIKIDRSFVRAMFESSEAITIIETILGLGRNLSIATVAEGIETPEQLAALSRFGCTYGQGYHLGRPMTGAAAADMLRAACQAGGRTPVAA